MKMHFSPQTAAEVRYFVVLFLILGGKWCTVLCIA